MLDLGRAPNDLYGVEYIGLVSPAPAQRLQAGGAHLDLSRAPYVVIVK